ncbi:hypothetical protein BGX26_012134 [Mortierella sp. AD094]|nr:hypothetical protein BGX26_012134 [Mortierella sp. AD094]
MSPQANFLWLSPSIINVLGYDPEELVGTSPYDIILREDITMTESVHREVAMDDLVAGQVSFRFRAKNGTYVAISLVKSFSTQARGKPILLFVRADELRSFVEQVDVSKSSGAIMHVRFWFQSPTLSHEIPCEAVLFGSSDGIVALMRKCKPFVRRHLIGSREHYAPTDSDISQNASWSSCSTMSASSPPAASISRPIPPKLPMVKLKNIKILDRNDGHIRLLDEVLKDDPEHAQEIGVTTQGLGIREYSRQEYVDDDDADDDVNDDTTYIQEKMRKL